MDHSFRAALGTVQPDADGRLIFWGLLDALERNNWHTQVFHGRSHFVCTNGAIVVTGQDYRHLDSWLMSRPLCRALFHHGTRCCDFALVEGQFDAARRSSAGGGSLDTLCQWLGLPKLVTVDARRLTSCHLPYVPEDAAGLLLDGVSGEESALRLKATLETLFGVPVIGWLPELPRIRDSIVHIPVGRKPPRDLCTFLGQRLTEHLDWNRLRRATACSPVQLEDGSLLHSIGGTLRVGVAYDDAFQCYFHDTFDLLEMLGASLRDFSPIRSGELPKDVDLLYFGCGPVHEYAGTLARNCCMREAIHRYVRRGGRIYGEGAGLAYLGKQLRVGQQSFPMAGVLPAVVELADPFQDLEAAEVTLLRNCWLGHRGRVLRGYYNPNWRVELLDEKSNLGRAQRSEGGAQHAGDESRNGHQHNGCRTKRNNISLADPLIGFHHVIGSRVHLNFAAQMDLLERFFIHPQHQMPTSFV